MENYTLAPLSQVTKFTIQDELYKDSKIEIHKATERSGLRHRQVRIVAIKMIKVDENKIEENKRREVYSKYMETIDNPHVLQYFNSFYTTIRGSLEYWIIMEYCSFKSIDEYWKSNAIIQQDQNLFFISDIAIGLEYIYETLNHQHLHLYPCNILLSRDSASIFPKVKLSNFGLCDQFEQTIPNELELCDVDYAAPEYLNWYSHSKSDVWSFGMLIFKLLVGRLPFELMQMDSFSAIPAQVFIDVSSFIQNEMACDLLSKMLQYDPDERISMQEVLTHPFIQMCKNYKYGTQGKRENYKPLKQLDHGQFGQVFLAENTDHTQFAIKEISQRIDSLIREASCMRLCKHPNLVEYKDFFEWNHSMIAEIRGEQSPEGKYVYLVMEYCNAGNLEIYIKNKPTPLSNEEISYFLGEICSGLWYLHFNKRLIHRDLKPANLLLKSSSSKYPLLKIADYGFSRGIDGMMKSMVGTPLYEAPEIRKNQPYTAKADLYSLGVILYYMATKEFPFTDIPDVFQNAMTNELPAEFRDDIIINDQLKHLILHLITHHEKDRLSWKEVYKHPYVIQSLNLSKRIRSANDEVNSF
ncbi:protein kinase domain containing protein [Entamoeba histolytica KU27]|uniref:Protein kinase domain containing protein n=1 Tax=Entamoeba histolytica KU27 TaxID=885311 RepID=M2SBV8_ENTHI|nr:protein kinase domain containing protein [Entamoeba histolytica KU27]